MMNPEQQATEQPTTKKQKKTKIKKWKTKYKESVKSAKHKQTKSTSVPPSGKQIFFRMAKKSTNNSKLKSEKQSK